MGSYARFLNNLNRSLANPLRLWQGFNDLYDSVHGGQRYALSQLPIGKFRQFADEYQRWEDSYKNTGIDPRYSSAYGSGGIPYVSDLASPQGVSRMARSLVGVYTPEVVEDLGRFRMSSSIKMWPKNRLIGNADNTIDMEEY